MTDNEFFYNLYVYVELYEEENELIFADNVEEVSVEGDGL